MNKIDELQKAFLNQKVDVTENKRAPGKNVPSYSVAPNDPTIQALKDVAKNNELSLVTRFPNSSIRWDPPRTLTVEINQTAPGYWAITSLRVNGRLQP